MSRGPVSIKVISILAIILSAFLLFITPISLALIFLTTTDPVEAVLRKDAGYVVFTLFCAVFGFAAAVVMFFSAIASLKLKPWGRRGMLLVAYLDTLITIATTIFSIIYVLPLMDRAAAGGSVSPQILKLLHVVSAIGGLLVTFVINGIIIYFFSRKVAVDAFNGIFPATRTAFPVQLDADPQQPTQPM